MVKYITLTDLKFAVLCRTLKMNYYSDMNVRYFVKDNINDKKNLNSLVYSGKLDIFDTSYVLITLPTSIIKNIKIMEKLNKRYGKQKKSSHIVTEAPDKKAEKEYSNSSTGIILTFEIFVHLLLGPSNDDIYSLNNIFVHAISAHSIKLLDKNKKRIAYVINDTISK